MNERIKELAKQSTVDIKDEFGHWINSEFDKEKFAELIVKECADIATMNQFQWDSAGGYVLKHFGVNVAMAETPQTALDDLLRFNSNHG